MKDFWKFNIWREEPSDLPFIDNSAVELLIYTSKSRGDQVSCDWPRHCSCSPLIGPGQVPPEPDRERRGVREPVVGHLQLPRLHVCRQAVRARAAVGHGRVKTYV